MTDTTATTNNPTLWLPLEIWAMIVNLLSPDELMALSLVCKTFHRAVTDDVMLQPLYNRLYALDKTLSATLPRQGAALTFKRAFEKIQARQQEEIAYLTQHHPALMAKPEYVQALHQNSSVSLKSLEAKNTILDAINREIITSKIIDINSTELDLNQARITRLPVTLFQAEGYVNFWKNLTELDCDNNQLTALNVQGLVALQTLYCDNNSLTDLNLTGVSAAIKNRFAELERSLLFKRLSASDSFQTRQAIIAKLGADYTYKNCFYYCPVYAAKLFISDLSSQVYNLASSALSQTGAYLPSFGTNNNSPANPQQKRARDKEQEPNDEPEAKRRKKR